MKYEGIGEGSLKQGQKGRQNGLGKDFELDLTTSRVSLKALNHE